MLVPKDTVTGKQKIRGKRLEIIENIKIDVIEIVSSDLLCTLLPCYVIHT